MQTGDREKIKAYVVSSLYPRPSHCTSGTFVSDQAAALAGLGVDVRVCNPVPVMPWPMRHLRRYRDKKADPTFRDKLPVERPLWTRLPSYLLETTLRRRSYLDVIKAMKKLFGPEKPDIIHAHVLFPVGMVCAKAAKSLGLPLVVTVHGADSRVHITHPLRRAGVFRVYEAADRIICVSSKIKEDLVAKGLSPDKLEVIHNGMDLSKVHRGENPIAKAYQGRKMILGVGNLVHTKGFDIFLQALRILRTRYPDIVGVIVGGGKERQKLTALIQKLQLESVVEMVGYQPPAQTMAYMEACDIFCLPSWSEGFGIVYLEAMAHGKPAIAVEGQGISEVIEHGRTGLLVPPKNVQMVVESLKRLLNQPELCAEMGKAAKSLVHKKFSWEHNAHKCMELYQEILSRKSARLGEGNT